MWIPRLVRRCVLASCWAALALLAGCEGLGEEPTAAGPTGAVDQPPPYRAEGERLPSFSGADPGPRGWVKVDRLLWLHPQDVAAYRQGRIWDGAAYVPLERALPEGSGAEHSYRLRTDHVAVHTNASWADGRRVALAAQAHVARLLGEGGPALGLRLPAGPLKIVVAATRAELVQILQRLVPDPVAWGAFYDARTGNVYMSLEPAAHGALPWQADLRHEMTHQILDLSRPTARRTHAWARPWFWLWEAFAVWSEGLGEAGTVVSVREGRFRRRYAWGDWTPWQTLFQLPQAGFVGKHYDQAGSMMRWLLDEEAPARRAAMFALMGRLQAGSVPDAALLQALGMSVGAAESSWRATVGR